MRKTILFIIILFVLLISGCIIKTKDQQVIIVESLIDELPNIDKVTINDNYIVNSVLEFYNLLNDDLKSDVNNIEKLNQLIIKIKQLEDNAVKKIIVLINELPNIDDINSNNLFEQQTNEVRLSYDNLREDLKTRIDNIDILINIENKIKEIKEIKEQDKINQEVANNVITLINNLPSDISLEEENNIINIRIAYNNLTEKQKELVNNISILINAENKIEQLKQEQEKLNKINNVINLIDIISDVITNNEENNINNARQAYDELDNDLQIKVTNYHKLINAEEEFVLLTSKEYRVDYVLNKGVLDSAIYEEAKIITTNVNNISIYKYNVDFFNEKDGDVNAYKKYAMMYNNDYLVNDSASYKYNYKVGFSYNNTLELYVVNYISDTGTALDSTVKASSDYWIICNIEASNDLTKIKSIQINDYITINGDITSSGDCNIEIKIDRLTSTINKSSYYNIFKGQKTLLKPTREGYKFLGWYLSSNFEGDKITKVNDECTIYAKWIRDISYIDATNILDCVSDIVETTTEDELLLENDEAVFEWTSSNPKLYVINESSGKTIMANQTHKKQEVTVNCKILYKTGGIETVSKKIIINPITFPDLPNNPIATYFNTSASGSYRKYNSRYQTEKTYFSNTALKTLNIVYYAFAEPKADGSLKLYSESTFGPILKELKKYGIRVVVSLSGVTTELRNNFETIVTSTDGTLQKFAKNCLDLLEKWNYDGIDLDWEGSNMTAETYSKLMKALRDEMTSRSDEGGTPYMLTAAIPAYCWGSETKRYNWSDMDKYLDYLNIMSYSSQSSSSASHVSPLYNSEKDNAFGKYGVSGVGAVERYSGLGFPISKMLIGCAGYGKSYTVTGTSKYSEYPALGAKASLCLISEYEGKGSHASGTVFGNIIADLLKNPAYIVYTEYDSLGRVVGSYMYNSSNNIFITFESELEIHAKLDYCSQVPGLGLMCWAHNEDTSDNFINSIDSYKKIN